MYYNTLARAIRFVLFAGTAIAAGGGGGGAAPANFDGEPHSSNPYAAFITATASTDDRMLVVERSTSAVGPWDTYGSNSFTPPPLTEYDSVTPSNSFNVDTTASAVQWQDWSRNFAASTSTTYYYRCYSIKDDSDTSSYSATISVTTPAIDTITNVFPVGSAQTYTTVAAAMSAATNGQGGFIELFDASLACVNLSCKGGVSATDHLVIGPAPGVGTVQLDAGYVSGGAITRTLDLNNDYISVHNVTHVDCYKQCVRVNSADSVIINANNDSNFTSDTDDPGGFYFGFENAVSDDIRMANCTWVSTAQASGPKIDLRSLSNISICYNDIGGYYGPHIKFSTVGQGPFSFHCNHVHTSHDSNSEGYGSKWRHNVWEGIGAISHVFYLNENISSTEGDGHLFEHNHWISNLASTLLYILSTSNDFVVRGNFMAANTSNGITDDWGSYATASPNGDLDDVGGGGDDFQGVTGDMVNYAGGNLVDFIIDSGSSAYQAYNGLSYGAHLPGVGLTAAVT